MQDDAARRVNWPGRNGGGSAAVASCDVAATRVEFTVEPFREGRPGPHVQAAIDAAAADGLALDVGPFGTAFEADVTVAARAVAHLVEAAFGAGATRVSCQVTAVGAPEHPFAAALRPLVEALGVELVPPERASEGDVPLRWDGVVVAAARVPRRNATMHGALAEMLVDVERELGGPLAELGRAQKQEAARRLHERGAFNLRNAADEVADALGVSRVTIYNYLNAVRERA
jgi:uncharacterized protein YqgV (UPF0045/DUF77 family)